MGGRISAESQRGRKRVTRMVVIVVAAFASLWLPIQVCDLVVVPYNATAPHNNAIMWQQ